MQREAWARGPGNVVLTTGDAARRMGISAATVRQMADREELEAIRG